MYCKACGHLSADGTATCPKCGATLAVDFDIAPIAAHAEAVPERSPDGWPEDWEFDEELWARAIGPDSTDYYLAQFRRMHEGSSGLSWNWPSFFITILWMPYRRMWGWLAMYVFCPIAIGIPIQIISSSMSQTWASGTFQLVAAAILFLLELFAAFVVVPIAANNLYYRHLKDLIARTKAKYRSRDRVLKVVEEGGGTGKGGIVVGSMAAATVVIGTIVSIVTTHQLLQKATKARVAMLAATSVVQGVANEVQRTHKLPISILQFASNAGVRQNISDIQLDSSTGVITIELSFAGRSRDGRLFFEPDSTDWTHPVLWRCRPDDRAQKYAPIECQPALLEQMHAMQQFRQR